MKYLCIILVSLLSLNNSFANSEVIRNEKIEFPSTENIQKITAPSTKPLSITPNRTCKITINIVLENGTTIEGEVTIEGISLIKCWGLQIYDWFSDDY